MSQLRGYTDRELMQTNRWNCTIFIHHVCQEHCPIYMFFFIFLSFSCLNPHSFITTVMTLFISIFHSLTACLRIQYSTH
jgi:hypothetical protein